MASNCRTPAQVCSLGTRPRRTSGSARVEANIFVAGESNGLSGNLGHQATVQLGALGKDDQLGTANFITREVVANAARQAREGKVFSLAIPFDRGGPVHPARTPYLHFFAMVNAGGDAWGMALKSEWCGTTTS